MFDKKSKLKASGNTDNFYLFSTLAHIPKENVKYSNSWAENDPKIQLDLMQDTQLHNEWLLHKHSHI